MVNAVEMVMRMKQVVCFLVCLGMMAPAWAMGDKASAEDTTKEEFVCSPEIKIIINITAP